MSRCYPYPPPGYQKKAQQPDLSVPAAKAVQKEKHKSKDKEKEKKKDGEKDKDKKDKEKKDREKKEKDRDRDKEKKDKEKNKDKDKDKERRDKDKRDKDKESKREKRKKDVEANGTSNGDKDPRSSKLQRTDLLHSTEENGRVREIKTAAVVARPVDRDGKDAAKALDRDGKDAAKSLGKDGKDLSKPSDRDGKDAAKPRGSVGGPATRPSSVYSKEQYQPNGKVDRTLPPIVLSKPVTGGSQPGVKVEEAVSSKPAVKVEGAAICKPAVKVEETPSSSRPSNHNHHIDSNNSGSHRPSKLPDFSVCDTMPQRTSWSAVDDEEWLASSTERVPQKPKAEVGEDTSHQVWADAIFLPSVDMYALPYVVPY